MPDFSFDAVKEALAPTPPTRAQLIAARGGGGRGRGALAREILGLPAGRLPAKRTRQRTEYDNLMRGLQRAEAGEGRQRRSGERKLRGQIERLSRREQEQLIRDRLATLSVEGASVTIESIIQVDGERNTRRFNVQSLYLNAEAWGRIADAYRSGGDEEAADAFTTELAEAHGIPALSYRVTIQTYSRLEIAPETRTRRAA